MAENSKIQWTEATWNPTTGCTKISPGCLNCYIESTPPFRMTGRKFVNGKIPLMLHEDRLGAPLLWKKPRRVFVNSLSDLFHEDISDEFIDRVFAVMAVTPKHTYQVLTKRPERMRKYLSDPMRLENIYAHWHEFSGGPQEVQEWPLPHVWMGVTCEDEIRAKTRIPVLLRTPAKVRFLSCEPLLGPVDLDLCQEEPDCDGIYADRRHGIHWVIVGGESGHDARPCDLQWIDSIVSQCQAVGVPVFVKQLGANLRGYDERCWKCGRADWGAIDYGPGRHPGYENCNVCGSNSTRCADRKGGDPAEWPEDLRIREFPTVTA